MEGANKKRVREHERKSRSEKSAKRNVANQNRKSNSSMSSEEKRKKNNSENSRDNSNSCGGYMGLGVFDFPWLHESMISTSLDLSFPDAFFPFQDNDSCIVTTPIYEKFEENKLVWPVRGDGGLELEGFECIWSSLFTPSTAAT